MSRFNDMMRRARQDAVEGDWAPNPGTHQALVVEGDAFESRAGAVYAKTRLELRTPGHPDVGKHWDHLMSFATPEAQRMSVVQLGMYGFAEDEIDGLEDVEDLARHMAELVGTEVEVTCKAREGGDGVWTNLIASRGNGSSGIHADQMDLEQTIAADTAAADDDDLPF